MSQSNVGPVAGGTYSSAGGCFTPDAINQLENAAQLGTVGNGGLAITVGAATVSTLTATGNASVSGNLVVSGNVSGFPSSTIYSGATDAVTFPSAMNIAIFTSTGPDAATLAVPGVGDVGKILILVNTNSSANAVTTTANKILNGTATTYDTLTAPVHPGAVAVLIASNGFWNYWVFTTGTWVLSEV
jgi:hypothetical protein